MNTHILTTRRPLAAPPKISRRVPRLNTRAVRAWLDEPARHQPTPIAGHMYGLLLRPAERPDIDRRTEMTIAVKQRRRRRRSIDRQTVTETERLLDSLLSEHSDDHVCDRLDRHHRPCRRLVVARTLQQLLGEVMLTGHQAANSRPSASAAWIRLPRT